MSITIGYDFDKNELITNDAKQFNDVETNLLNKIIDMLSDSYNSNLFEIVKMSDDYTTLKLYNYDVCRIKYTDRAKWIKVLMCNELKDKYINNPLFEAQKNKNELYWKSSLNSDDFTIYKEIMLYTCDLAIKNK